MCSIDAQHTRKCYAIVALSLLQRNLPSNAVFMTDSSKSRYAIVLQRLFLLVDNTGIYSMYYFVFYPLCSCLVELCFVRSLCFLYFLSFHLWLSSFLCPYCTVKSESRLEFFSFYVLSVRRIRDSVIIVKIPLYISYHFFLNFTLLQVSTT